MDVEIYAEGRPVRFQLDWKNMRWHCADEIEEAVFPLIKVIDGKRYEFYSDETFAEVEM